jgi:hypothetical protein
MPIKLLEKIQKTMHSILIFSFVAIIIVSAIVVIIDINNILKYL